LSGIIDLVAQVIQDHAAWAAPIALVIAFLKALAFVSLVVPGMTILLTIGAVVGASHIPFVPVWFGVSIGAALGDWVSYSIGYRLKDRARHIWPFTKKPELMPRAERFFDRWGVMSVVLCRFIGPLRATIPILCGIFQMAYWPFQIANWLSAFLWAGTIMGPGTFLGAWLR
jgi:membrane protein DedA with SNARE-associated domain